MNQNLAFALAAFLTSNAGLVASPANPYQDISKRNVFQLQPLPTQVPDQRPPPVRRPPSLIHITGLVEIGGVSKALVEITAPGKAVQRRILAAGGVYDELEILQVDVARDQVRVRIDGAEEVLTIQRPKAGVAPPLSPPRPGPARPTHPFRG